MTSTKVRCQPWHRQPGLILGLCDMAGVVAAQAASSTPLPRGGSNEPPDGVVCPAFYSRWNQIYYAQAVFSSLSIVMCLAAMAVLCKAVI